jgi:hypothetical protein
MHRLLAFLALLLLALAPAAARGLPAMSCCPPAMSVHDGHHGDHRPALPADASDCAAHVAAVDALPVVEAGPMPPTLRPMAALVALPAGVDTGAELRPPRRG